jgi:hypothetical protein
LFLFSEFFFFLFTVVVIFVFFHSFVNRIGILGLVNFTRYA